MLRDHFHIPTDASGAESIYLCGNSLGLLPKGAGPRVEAELERWRYHGVRGWWGDDPEQAWLNYHERLQAPLAAIVGARPEEVVTANALTVNLHLLMVSFFQPRGKRRKIILERGAFPSDQHAVIAQLRFHGLDPEVDLVEVAPRPGEIVLRTEDIVAAIHEVGDELALVLWSGVQYYTGQFFALAPIVTAGHAVGAKVGLDLAHAVGNVPLKLHDWNCDFAAWCSYKYLNGGPGAPGGLFVHERYAEQDSLPRFAGWWGHRVEDRFAMAKEFRPALGAAGWQVSTVPVLGMAPLVASMPLFGAAGGISALRTRSLELTGKLLELLAALPGLRVLTPQAEAERGAQLSVFVPGEQPELEERLYAQGLICDYRHDNLYGGAGGVLRLAPAPLYNTAKELERVPGLLAEVLNI